MQDFLRLLLASVVISLFFSILLQKEVDMEAAYRRHDISDKVWELLEPYLPDREGTRGATARDNRNFLNAVFWIFRTRYSVEGFTP